MKLWLERIGVFFIATAIVLTVFVFTFAITVAEPVDFAYEETTLSFSGKVEVSSGSGKDFSLAKTKQKITEGGHVRTGEKSSAVITFADGSELRLDQNTEVALQTLRADSKTKKIQVAVKILNGRVWAQLNEFFDQDSYFSVESDIAIAKAAGTAFAFSIVQEKSDIFAIQHRTLIGSRKEKSGKISYHAQLPIEPGNHVVIDPAKIPETIADIDPQKTTDEIINSDWFRENRALAKTFADKQKERIEERVKKAAGISPLSRFYFLKLLGEQTRRTFIFSDESLFEFDRKITERRLLEALKVADENKTLAMKLVNEFDENITNLLTSAKHHQLIGLQTDLLYNQQLLAFLGNKLPDKKAEILKFCAQELDKLKTQLEKEKTGNIEKLAEKIQDSFPELILEYKDTPAWLKPKSLTEYRKYIEYGSVTMFDIQLFKTVTTPSPVGPLPTEVPATATNTPTTAYPPVASIAIEGVDLVVIVPVTLSPRVVAFDASGNPLPVDQEKVSYNIPLTINSPGHYTLTATYQGKSASISFEALPPATSPSTSVSPTNTPP